MTDCRATISHRTMTTVVEAGCPYATPAEHRGAVADGVNTALRLPTQPLAPSLRWESDFKYVRSNDLAAAQAWSHARPKKNSLHRDFTLPLPTAFANWRERGRTNPFPSISSSCSRSPRTARHLAALHQKPAT